MASNQRFMPRILPERNICTREKDQPCKLSIVQRGRPPGNKIFESASRLRRLCVLLATWGSEYCLQAEETRCPFRLKTVLRTGGPLLSHYPLSTAPRGLYTW